MPPFFIAYWRRGDLSSDLPNVGSAAQKATIIPFLRRAGSSENVIGKRKGNDGSGGTSLSDRQSPPSAKPPGNTYQSATSSAIKPSNKLDRKSSASLSSDSKTLSSRSTDQSSNATPTGSLAIINIPSTTSTIGKPTATPGSTELSTISKSTATTSLPIAVSSASVVSKSLPPSETSGQPSPTIITRPGSNAGAKLGAGNASVTGASSETSRISATSTLKSSDSSSLSSNMPSQSKAQSFQSISISGTNNLGGGSPSSSTPTPEISPPVIASAPTSGDSSSVPSGTTSETKSHKSAQDGSNGGRKSSPTTNPPPPSATSTGVPSSGLSTPSSGSPTASAQSHTQQASAQSSARRSSSSLTGTTTSDTRKVSKTAVVKVVQTSDPSDTTSIFSTTVFSIVVPTTFESVQVISSGSHRVTTTQASVGSQTVTTTQVSQFTPPAGSGGNSSGSVPNHDTDLGAPKKNAGAIAGSVVGALVLVTLLVSMALYLLRRRNRIRDDRYIAQVLSAPHPDLFRPAPDTGWDIERQLSTGSLSGPFVRPMAENGARLMMHKNPSLVPSVSEDPFWDPSQGRALENIPITPNNDKIHMGTSAAAAHNPFADPPDPQRAPPVLSQNLLMVADTGGSRLSNSSSMFDSHGDIVSTGSLGLAM